MAFLDKLNVFAREVGDRATDAVKIGKLNMKIGDENAAITKLMHQIGELYYAAWSCGKGPGEALARLCEEVDAHKRTIDQLRAQIAAIRDANLCPGCGAENPKGAAFCSTCGHALKEKPEPEGAAGPETTPAETETAPEEQAHDEAEAVMEKAAEESHDQP